MLRPAHGIRNVHCAFAARVFDQHSGDFEEEILGDAANLLNQLRCITSIVPLQDLKDAARVLQCRVALDLSGMGMRDRSLSLLSVWHDMLFVADASFLRFTQSCLLALAGLPLLLRLSRLRLLLCF